jgi:hypothetical protein
MVMGMDFDELAMIYSVTCKNAGQRNALKAMQPSEVSHAVKARVRQDHKWVLKQIENPVNKRKVFIIKAEQEGIIEVNKNDNSIHYTSSESDTPFFRAGEGLDPIGELAMAYDRNPDIKNILREIKESVSLIEDKRLDEKVRDVSAEKIDELAAKKAEELVKDTDWKDVIIGKGIANGSIELKASWHYFKFEGDDVKIQGKKTMKEFIDEHPLVIPIFAEEK